MPQNQARKSFNYINFVCAELFEIFSNTYFGTKSDKKDFELYQVFLCQISPIFTKISELYQVSKCSNILKLYTLKALLSKNWFYLYFLIF